MHASRERPGLCGVTACRWTVNWACPGSAFPGRRGYAHDDGTHSFRCCCPTPLPPPAPPPRHRDASGDKVSVSHPSVTAQRFFTAQSCFCFSLCQETGRGTQPRILSPEGTSFVARARGVEIHSSSSPWADYFAAVYNGQSPLPHQLGRLSFVYTNTPAWRSRHSPSANPFHDCDDPNQMRCSDARCGLWERELLPPPGRPGGAVNEIMGMFEWPFSSRDAEDLKGIQFYSRDTDHVGRAVYEDNEWLEIMRGDARPYFAEGERPTDCTDWNPGDPYRNQHCWSRLYPYAGGRFPPGCWARPAPGAPERASVVGEAAPISITLAHVRFRSMDQRGQDETRAVPRGRRPQCH